MTEPILALGDVGRYRSVVGEKRWRHGAGVAVSVATEDAPAFGIPRPAIRVLRVRPSTPAPDGSNSSGAVKHGEFIDLLEFNVEVHRGGTVSLDGVPDDIGQGESVLLNRDQAIVVRRALDAFIDKAEYLLEAEKAELAIQKERESLADTIRSTGDPFGRT